jgi:phospholipase C
MEGRRRPIELKHGRSRIPFPAAAVLALSLALAACGTTGNSAQTQPTASPAKPATPSASPGSTKPNIFVIVMENKSYDQALTGTYTAALARKYGVATNYHAVAYPSLPNYLALTSGSTWGIRDDGYYRLPKQNLGTQLTQAGIPWRAYVEGFQDDCFNSPYPYALKHNPFAYYGGACPSNIVPFSQLDADLASQTPNLVWISPDMCHSTHDCSVHTGDAWLESIVPRILASSAWKRGGYLYITWDEDAGVAGNRVATLVVAPHLKGQQSDARYDHYSLFATIQDQLGVPRLGQAVSARPLTEFLKQRPARTN